MEVLVTLQEGGGDKEGRMSCSFESTLVKGESYAVRSHTHITEWNLKSSKAPIICRWAAEVVLLPKQGKASR